MQQHPFEALAPEYAHIWATAKTLPGREHEINELAKILLDDAHMRAFEATQKATGVPVLWHAPVLFRESGGDLTRYLGNGDRLNQKTVDVPRDRGPFDSYEAGAEDALRYDHVDQIDFWTIERMLYEDELWNGFGYRNKGILSPYLVGGTNLQQPGKYIADGRWDSTHMDEQLGTIPIAKRMLELRPDLVLPNKATGPLVGLSGGLGRLTVLPMLAPEGLGGPHDTDWVQASLNQLGFGVLVVDGSYGRRTRNAVMEFQRAHDLEVDGLVGPLTIAALSTALRVLAAT